MLMSLEDAYNVFVKTYPNMKIGFTMFRKLRPVQVSWASETNRHSCLCEKCSNVALKVEALKRFKSTHHDLKGVEIVSKRQIVSNTLCKSEKPYADMKCIDRQCSKCGTQKIQDEYRAFSQFNEETIKWHKWERVNIEVQKRKKNVMSCVPKETKFKDFFSEYIKDIDQLAKHLFIAEWHTDQLKVCSENLKESEAILSMNFAEDYACHYQNDIQSGFFDTCKVTIHPMHGVYKQRYENELVTVKHSIIGITDNNIKDNRSVREFENIAIEKIQDQMISELLQIHEFTDGCTKQYKGQNAFYDISQSENITIYRNFY